jgi:hypothetical protein
MTDAGNGCTFPAGGPVGAEDLVGRNGTLGELPARILEHGRGPGMAPGERTRQSPRDEPIPRAGGHWTWLVVAAYTQLRPVRGLVADRAVAAGRRRATRWSTRPGGRLQAQGAYGSCCSVALRSESVIGPSGVWTAPLADAPQALRSSPFDVTAPDEFNAGEMKNAYRCPTTGGEYNGLL